MQFTKLVLQNWMNFRNVDVPLRERIFVVGPNASGKSNLLAAFRFLRDVAEARGGLQYAVEKLGGMSSIRSLHARRHPEVVLDVEMSLDDKAWRYRLVLAQNNQRRVIVKEENVWRAGDRILTRPDRDDEADAGRLAQTHLEQVSANAEFRDVQSFFAQVRYLHIVPQLIRDPERYMRQNGGHDPFGGDFLEQLARMQKEQRRTFDSRLKRLNEALKVAVPQFRELKLERDEAGRPHLRALFEHWRPEAGWQNEEQFSDGTLRLLGLLWALLDGTRPLLVEEPELSLHEAVVRHLTSMMWKATRKNRRQLFVSTHSAALLSDKGIAPEEVLLLTPSPQGTSVIRAAESREILALLESDLSMGEAVLPRVAPPRPEQLLLGFAD
ncbi:AAA family ATPase [Candidatus Binatia bacterium]|nr:AAA family ATPase [Candidatus Binatia bacterium]